MQCTGYKTEPHLEEESVTSSHQCAEDTSCPNLQPTAENMALSLYRVFKFLMNHNESLSSIQRVFRT